MYNIKYDTDAEVLGEVLNIFITALPTGQESRARILKKHGIIPENGHWYKVKNILDAYYEIASKIGSSTLFMLGIAIATKGNFPPYESLEQALNGLDMVYHLHHRLHGTVMFDSNTGKVTQGIGNYSCIKFDKKKREAHINTSIPYPSKLDEGILTQVVRMFKPKDSISQQVTLDLSKETRDTGGKSCTFIIKW